MTTFIFYIAAVSLCGVSTVLIHNATSYISVGATVAKTKLIAGRVMIAIAAVSAGMGVIAQITSAHH